MPTIPDGLTFDAASHTYTWLGQPCPSVTSILEPYSGVEYVDPELLAATAAFGNHVHDAIDLDNRGELDEAALEVESPLVWQYLQQYRRFLEESGAVVLASEQKVIHPTLRYAGTLDSVMLVGKTRRIYDIKTTSSVPRTVGPQVAAYAEAYAAMTGQRPLRRYSLQLKADRYAVHPLTDPQDWDIFRSALLIHRWQRRQ